MADFTWSEATCSILKTKRRWDCNRVNASVFLKRYEIPRSLYLFTVISRWREWWKIWLQQEDRFVQMSVQIQLDVCQKLWKWKCHSYKLIFYSLIPDQRNETAKTSSTSFNISGETSYLIFGFSISPLPLFGTAGASSPSFEKRFGCQTPRQW